MPRQVIETANAALLSLQLMSSRTLGALFGRPGQPANPVPALHVCFSSAFWRSYVITRQAIPLNNQENRPQTFLFGVRQKTRQKVLPVRQKQMDVFNQCARLCLIVKGGEGLCSLGSLLVVDLGFAHALGSGFSSSRWTICSRNRKRNRNNNHQRNVVDQRVSRQRGGRVLVQRRNISQRGRNGLISRR